MKLNEFINEAKKVLNIKECDGGEGLAYRIEYKGTLPEHEDYIIEKTSTNDDKTETVLKLKYPKDPGFVSVFLKNLGIEILKIELLY